MRSPRLLPTAALAAALLLLPAAPALADAPTISGTVTLGGTVRAGVPVARFAPDGREVTATYTDAQGHYSLTAPAQGQRYVVAINVRQVLTEPRASVDGFLPQYVGDAAPAAAAPLVQAAVAGTASRTLDLVVPAATRVSGRNAAFAGRDLRLLTLQDRVAATVRAGSTGAWSFRVAPGRYRLVADGTRTWAAYRSKPFTVVQGVALTKTSHPVRTAAVAGRLLTPQGAPVRGAAVRVVPIPAPDDFDDPPLTTDATGRFRLTGRTPGRYAVLVGTTGDANDRSTAIGRRREVVLKGGATTTADFVLRTGATVQGVYDTDTGAKTWTMLLKRRDAQGTVVRTDVRTASSDTARNAFTIRGLATGTYVLQLVDSAGRRSAQRTIAVQAGRTTRLGTVRPDRPTLTLSGRTAAGATVSVSSGVLFASGKAGADGAYRVTGLIAGSAAVSVVAPGRVRADSTVVLAGDTAKDLAVGAAEPGRGAVVGTVLAGEVPVPNAGLALEGAAVLQVLRGRLEAAAVPEGVHRVVAFDAYGDDLFPAGTPYGLEWTGADPVVVQPGATTDLGTVRLRVVG